MKAFSAPAPCVPIGNRERRGEPKQAPGTGPAGTIRVNAVAMALTGGMSSGPVPAPSFGCGPQERCPMSVRLALAKLSACAVGGAMIGGGAVHVAEQPRARAAVVKQSKVYWDFQTKYMIGYY